MSHTNTTPNYNLPQFVGTDKPAWLTDINQAFSNVDTAIKSTKDTADTATGSATTANNSIGTLADLNTTNKSTLVGAINEVNTSTGTATGIANQAVSLANQAQTDANSANELIQALASFVNINAFTNFNETTQMTRLAGTGNCTYNNITVATNADKSLCKIYGSFIIGSTDQGSVKWKLNVDTGLRPTEKIVVQGNLYATPLATGSIANKGTVTINTDGTLEFDTYNNGGSRIEIDLWACVIWVKNFGDTTVTS